MANPNAKLFETEHLVRFVQGESFVDMDDVRVEKEPRKLLGAEFPVTSSGLA